MARASQPGIDNDRLQTARFLFYFSFVVLAVFT